VERRWNNIVVTDILWSIKTPWMSSDVERVHRRKIIRLTGVPVPEV